MTLAPSMPEFDIVLTNPPYSIKDDYLARCYQIGKPFALLLPIAALGGSRRQRMYAQYGIEIILLGGRIKLPTPSGKGSGSWFETAWFTHGLNIGRQLTFATLEGHGNDGSTTNTMALCRVARVLGRRHLLAHGIAAGSEHRGGDRTVPITMRPHGQNPERGTAQGSLPYPRSRQGASTRPP